MRKILFSPPDITDDEINEVAEVLRSGWITTGPKAKLFEKEAADYCGVKRAAAFNSATAGLELTLRVLGIKEGDEVITSAYTYTASASVIAHTGASIVLCDTLPGSYEISPSGLFEAVTERTKAVIPIDIGGELCDYGAIFKVLNDKKQLFKPQNKLQESIGRVAVVADAAHSFGAEKNGIKAGKFADFTVFSTHAVKNLTTAEGGIVVWNNERFDDDAIYKNFMLYGLHGQDKDAFAKSAAGAWEYDIKLLGYKYNLTDVAAAIGLAQLRRYGGLLKRRHEIAERYQKGLNSELIEVMAHKNSSCHLMLTRINGADEDRRNRIIDKFTESGIAVNVHYKPLPMHTAYKSAGFDIKDFPNAFGMYRNELTLPLHTKLSNDDADYITETYNSLVRRI
jgi:dTDP-4-amino-4,6-dideoxygalactose transaminase